MDITTIAIAALVGLVIGLVVAKVLEKGKASKTVANAKKEANTILKAANTEGENIKKDKIFQAMVKF